VLAPPRSLSQRATSFIASYRQGIHRMLLSRLIDHLSKKRSCTVRTAPRSCDHDTHGLARAERARRCQSPSYASTGSACAHGRTLIHDVIEPPARSALTNLFLKSCESHNTALNGVSHPKLAHGTHSPPSLKLRRASYPRFASVGWWSRTGSNRRPEACKATALPTELRPHGVRSRQPRSTASAIRSFGEAKDGWPGQI
jgi:hypothetical protein